MREIGGAYGGGASWSTDGTFSFSSYRDPNCAKTADVFQSCVEWAADARFTDEDVAQAKLSLFSSIDAPLPPSSRGLGLFTNGLSDQSRQQFRNGMLCPFPLAAAPWLRCSPCFVLTSLQVF